MPTLAELQAELADDLILAQEEYEQAVASNPPVTVPTICTIPSFPPGATDAQKIAAVQCAIRMVDNYITCINGDPQNWASCVANVCSAFTVCWNNAFGVT